MSEDRKDSKAFDGMNIESLPQWLRDFIDLQNEAADRSNTGRAKRFFPDDRSEVPTSEKKKRERAFSELIRRLQDPHYARLYFAAVEAVTKADKAVSAALAEIATETDVARQRLERLRQSAAELPDGTKVFRSNADGHLYTEDDRDVTDLKDSVNGLSEASPSREACKEAKAILDDLGAERSEIETYRRDMLDPAKERLGDTENSPSEDELLDFGNIKGTLPLRGQKHLTLAESGVAKAEKKSSADEVLSPAPLNAPDVSGAFKTVRDDVCTHRRQLRCRRLFQNHPRAIQKNWQRTDQGAGPSSSSPGAEGSAGRPGIPCGATTASLTWFSSMPTTVTLTVLPIARNSPSRRVRICVSDLGGGSPVAFACSSQ